MDELLIRYAHFIGIMVLAAALVGEHLLLSANMTRDAIRRVAVLDAIYGVAAVVVFVAGLALWLWVGKPSSFYSGNSLLHLKVTLFVLVGVLSIYPTLFFLRNRNSTHDVIVVPAAIITVVRIEITLLLLIPLLAVLMARGYGSL